MANKPDMKKTTKKRVGLTGEELDAMKERMKELNAGGDKGDLEEIVMEKIAAMPEPDRAMAKRLHTLIKASVPGLSTRLWYGMPAYAKDGKTICFFQDAHKFKSRYAMLGFSDKAHLDEGSMWPVYFALKKLTPTEEAKIIALVKRAVGS
jgi:hypothetical protein